MAFNFLGTYDEEQIRGLLEFARQQLDDVDAKINHLQSEIQRYGWLSYSKDDEGSITGFSITPPQSQLAKYVRTYHYYGGDVRDLNILSRGDWLYRSKGSIDDDVHGGGFQGGKIQGADYPDNLHLDDTNAANTTTKVKDWMADSIRRKREEFEFRIKRSIDLVDQHLESILLMVRRSEGAETIEALKGDIEHFLTQEDYQSAGDKERQTGLPEEIDRT